MLAILAIIFLTLGMDVWSTGRLFRSKQAILGAFAPALFYGLAAVALIMMSSTATSASGVGFAGYEYVLCFFGSLAAIVVRLFVGFLLYIFSS